ncbi:hypothetical protein N8A98_07075 [Devosia neptuniae]|uniref:Uncharacterized protein n=1 Tax=Devosia neptuniae TaxID=191302 RepID=A0ABY6CFC1_9HYPH|nr:hypothetical protein [Devosia neptuniae]UXN70944.1 hypothetical protein N8A98_07075 [Devosia neptuniae]
MTTPASRVTAEKSEVHTGHTEGPWHGDGEPVSHPHDAMIVIYREDGTEIGFAHSREDARLIAAAPDLLEALRDYLFAEEIDDPSVRQSELAVARQAAETAIAKAEGRAS